MTLATPWKVFEISLYVMNVVRLGEWLHREARQKTPRIRVVFGEDESRITVENPRFREDREV